MKNIAYTLAVIFFLNTTTAQAAQPARFGEAVRYVNAMGSHPEALIYDFSLFNESDKEYINKQIQKVNLEDLPKATVEGKKIKLETKGHAHWLEIISASENSFFLDGKAYTYDPLQGFKYEYARLKRLLHSQSLFEKLLLENAFADDDEDDHGGLILGLLFAALIILHVVRTDREEKAAQEQKVRETLVAQCKDFDSSRADLTRVNYVLHAKENDIQHVAQSLKKEGCHPTNTSVTCRTDTGILHCMNEFIHRADEKIKAEEASGQDHSSSAEKAQFRQESLHYSTLMKSSGFLTVLDSSSAAPSSRGQ